MIKVLIILVQILVMLPLPVIALDNHWAKNEIQELNTIDGIHIDQPDTLASIELQESIFKIIGLKIVPEVGLKRYWLIKHMAHELHMPESTEEEIELFLGKHIDLCNYCKKANLVLATAVKYGLLKGRITEAGLVIAPKEAVTSAELAVFALRYLSIK